MVLIGRRAQALRQQREAGHAQRQLAAAAGEDRSVDANKIAEVEFDQLRHRLFAEPVGARLHLHPAAAVDDVEEGHLALAAARGEATSDAVGVVALFTGLQLLPWGLSIDDRDHAREVVREWLHALGADPLQLRSSGGEQLARLIGRLVAH